MMTIKRITREALRSCESAPVVSQAKAASIIGMLLFSLSSASAWAQSIQLGADVARPVEGVGHNYIHGLAETVNPATGTLSIKMDLPVPKSRGLSLPFALMYNSGAMYNLESFETGVMVVNNTAGFQGLNKPTELGVSGWSDTFPYTALSTWTIPIAPPGSNVTGTCTYSSSYAFYDPSGASHTLGISAEGNPNVVTGNVATSACSQLNNYLAVPYGGDSQVKAQSSSLCNGIPNGQTGCDTASPPFVVSDKSGNNYFFPTGYSAQATAGTSYRAYVFPSSIEDRNGNVLQVNSSAPYGSTAASFSISITDTMGRTMAAKDSSHGLPTSYQIGGLNYGVSWLGGTSAFTLPSTFVAPAVASGTTCTLNTTVNGIWKGISTLRRLCTSSATLV